MGYGRGDAKGSGTGNSAAQVQGKGGSWRMGGRGKNGKRRTSDYAARATAAPNVACPAAVRTGVAERRRMRLPFGSTRALPSRGPSAACH